MRILPDVRFGRPSIKGISTEVLWEQDEAGLDVEETAETYQLDVPDVRWALAYMIPAGSLGTTRAGSSGTTCRHS
ncbi:DUF433 domain-containing protein [Micromonospora sp. NPDC048170]|uniref:DUF433 domain-containing protein n=1 Tax=Micromonospora sp. NPDC048170 TaxID=3154819 RepID=UPI0033FF8483